MALFKFKGMNEWDSDETSPKIVNWATSEQQALVRIPLLPLFLAGDVLFFLS